MQKEPFKDISFKDMKRYVVNENSRPVLNDNIPEEIKLIIRSCWQRDPELRPNIHKIIEIIKNIEVE